jgi:hypothetical protein
MPVIRLVHAWAPAAFVLAFVGSVADLRAEDKQACVTSYEQAQILRKAGKLLGARSELTKCKNTCPAVLRADCDGWLDDTQRRIATVLVEASDALGRKMPAVSVSLDDDPSRPVAQNVDAGSIALDPGEHVLRFETAGAAPVRQRIAVAEGEKDRIVAVRFESAPGRDREAPTEAPAPVAAYVAAGIGALGLVGVAYFGVQRAEAVDSLDRCKGSCNLSDVRSANLDLYLGGVSAVVALAGSGVGLYLYLTRAKASPSGQGASGALHIGVREGGLGLRLEGSFD